MDKLNEKIDIIVAKSLDEDFKGDYDLKTALQIVEELDGKEEIAKSLEDQDLMLMEEEGLLTEHHGTLWMSKMGEKVLKDLSRGDPGGQSVNIWKLDTWQKDLHLPSEFQRTRVLYYTVNEVVFLYHVLGDLSGYFKVLGFDVGYYV